MKRLLTNEILTLLFLIVIFIFVRSLYFSYHLNFSTDQATSALRSLEIWRNKEITLIGPSVSFSYIGRNIFTSSIVYYFQLLFLLPVNFDPIASSYLFMLFSSLMIIPLYFGANNLIGKNGGLLMTALFTLLPFYVDYTRFLWNPNFQFALTPILLLFMGLHQKTKKGLYLFLSALFSGVLLLFHYQFLIVVVALLIYYFVIKRLSLKSLLLFLSGFVLGFSPILIFELRNNFYNIQTLILYLINLDKAFSKGVFSSFNYHYILSISLFLFLILIFFIRKTVTNSRIAITFIFLFIFSLFFYVKKPTHAFGMVDHWNYLYEKEVYEIIKKEKLKNFNVVNLGYDTKANVQKYLLKKEGIKINYDDYYHNKYLFVITNKKDFMNDPAYEIGTFRPSRRLKNWKINSSFNLYLLERT